jgi:hypothetical protein
MVRSHFHGEEEEEGCQEGRQEEEGPRLSHPLRRFSTDALRSAVRAFSTRRNHVFRQGCSARDPMRGILQSVSTACPSSSPGAASAGQREDVSVQTRKAGPGPWAPGPA